MCKTYETIYELVKHTESDILICALPHAQIEGKLTKCNFKKDEDTCYEDIVTLEDAIVKCHNSQETKEYKWINIPSKHIQAFAFKCCEKNQ